VGSLRDIRRRIGSVKKTQQITRAMRMVAAAKLRRAQEAIESARPYAERMRSTLEEVVGSFGGGELEHPLLVSRESVKRVQLVVITSDRGLCGAFNANILKHAEAATREQRGKGREVVYGAVGRKALEWLRRRGREIPDHWTGIGSVGMSHAAPIVEALTGRFLQERVDEVHLLYNEFVSPVSQRPRSVRLLPYATADASAAGAGGRGAAAGRGEAPAEGAASQGGAAAEERAPFTIEPSPEELLARLVPRAVEVEVYRALLENQAGEHAARMAAMESATRNTEEMIDELTLSYNRARQAAITKELVEIVSGAEAL